MSDRSSAERAAELLTCYGHKSVPCAVPKCSRDAFLLVKKSSASDIQGNYCRACARKKVLEYKSYGMRLFVSYLDGELLQREDLEYLFYG